MCEFPRAPSYTQCPAAAPGGDHFTSALFFLAFFFPSLIFKECEMSHVEGGCLGYLGTATLVAQRSLCDPSNTTPQFCQPGSRWELKLLVLCAV